MQVLGYDCALDACAVALWRDGAVAAQRAEPMRRGQAEALAPMLDAVCRDAGVAAAALDAVAVTVGPGGFTGLRIGIAAARGLALALGIPAVGVTTTDAVAAAQPAPDAADPAGGLLVAIGTKRADLYLALYDADPGAVPEPIAGPAAVEPDAIAAFVAGRAQAAGANGPLRVAGDAEAAAGTALTAAGIAWTPAGGPALPEAGRIAAIGAHRLDAIAARGAVPDPPAPVYLRPPDATPPAAPSGAAS